MYPLQFTGKTTISGVVADRDIECLTDSVMTAE